MGVQIAEILAKKEVSIDEFSGKTIAVDAFNHLYQFLSTIRQRDGTPLMDSHGNVTSHLSGLFSRTTNLLERNIRLIYVFDGKSPGLKLEEQERRSSVKAEAEAKYRIAAEKRDLDEMKKYASRTSRLTEQMLAESRELLRAMGIPVVDAPSEGEAQAAQIVKDGQAFAVSSQDSDSLLFGSPYLIRNLSISGRRKRAGKLAYEAINPELISLQEVLGELGLTREQLIVLGILVGTDYNRAGIKGIGPKNALKLLKKHGTDFKGLFREVKWSDYYATDWKEIFGLFTGMPVAAKYHLEWGAPDAEKIKQILVGKHDFSGERVDTSIARIGSAMQKGRQKGLGEFF